MTFGFYLDTNCIISPYFLFCEKCLNLIYMGNEMFHINGSHCLSYVCKNDIEYLYTYASDFINQKTFIKECFDNNSVLLGQIKMNTHMFDLSECGLSEYNPIDINMSWDEFKKEEELAWSILDEKTKKHLENYGMGTKCCGHHCSRSYDSSQKIYNVIDISEMDESIKKLLNELSESEFFNDKIICIKFNV